MEYKAEELGKRQKQKHYSLLRFVMTSFRFMKDIFGGEVAPCVQLTQTRKKWEYWQSEACKLSPIKSTEKV